MLSEAASNEELLTAILEAVERSRSSIVIPTDDAAVVALQAAAATARRSARQGSLLDVLDASLGEARHRPTVRSRKAFADFAAATGVRLPAHACVHTEADALAFASTHGYPLVLKAEESFAGFGVSICKDEASLKSAMLGLSQNPAALREGVLAQAFVEGRTAMRVVCAYRGRVLGGLSAIKLETWPGSTGPSCVVELVDHSELNSAAERLIQGLGFSGFASLDFMLDSSGHAHLIELNPRPTPITHLGERYGGSLCRLLHAAITGEPTQAGNPQGLPSKVVLFPQEWVRCSKTPHLEPGVFHDVPWDEPDLVEAYIAMARAQMRFGAFRTLHARQERLRAMLLELEQPG
jgi:hypothetical protein